jgi:anaerobic selenocysteine-containing dehydrogenase
LASNGSLWTVPDVKNRIKKLQDRGGKFIVIDPRKTETAKLADKHYHVKPGTDTALFIGLLLALDKHNLINPKAFKSIFKRLG